MHNCAGNFLPHGPLGRLVGLQATHGSDRRQVTRNSCLEQLDEFMVHELVLVANIQAYDPNFTQVFLELGRELVAVRALHDKDDVCPFQQFGCDRILGIVIEAGRRCINARPVGKDMLRSRAA